MPKSTTKKRLELRSLFLRNAIPTEEDYADLIAAGLNQADDGILKLPDQPLGLVRQQPTPSAPSPSTASTTSTSSSPSTASTAAAAPPPGVLNFFGAPEDDNPSWQLQLIGSSNPGFGLADRAGITRLFLDGTTGNLGVGTTTPRQKLVVEGPLSAVKDEANTLRQGGQLAIKGSSAQLDFIDSDPGQTDWAINVDQGKLSFVRAPDSKDLVIDDKGNVGIGTESLTAKLNVAGNIFSTGIIQATGYRLMVHGFEFQLNDGLLTPVNKSNLETKRFDYSGQDELWTVPAGVEWIFVKLWGAGGGAGRPGCWNYGADGGGGGHTRGLFKVSPNERLILVVGRGGTTANGKALIYGGGGSNHGNLRGNSDNFGGHGGGLCGIFRVSSSQQANALAIAGGGGGGGASRHYRANHGGAGGGKAGQRGASPFDGKTSAGGGGGTQNRGGQFGKVDTSEGEEGKELQGGCSAPVSNGGGGGGGYWGGGGGAYSESRTMGGGGGSSGFTAADGLLTGTYAGRFRIPPYSWDPDLIIDVQPAVAPLGFGGEDLSNIDPGYQSGGHARAVIYHLKQ